MTKILTTTPSQYPFLCQPDDKIYHVFSLTEKNSSHESSHEQRRVELEQALPAAGELRDFYMIDPLWKIEADLESFKESCLA